MTLGSGPTEMEMITSVLGESMISIDGTARKAQVVFVNEGEDSSSEEDPHGTREMLTGSGKPGSETPKPPSLHSVDTTWTMNSASKLNHSNTIKPRQVVAAAP